MADHDISYSPGPGYPALIYRYTITGSDKASIDTGVDASQAGSNDWTNGDLLEVWFYGRTDQAVAIGDAVFTFNNDTGSTQYVHERMRAVSNTPTSADNSGAANIDVFCPAANDTANVFGIARITIPNYTGTVGYKSYEITNAMGSTTAGQNNWLSFGGTYQSTSAITRLAVANLSTFKFKVGSQLLIYKRVSI